MTNAPFQQRSCLLGHVRRVDAETDPRISAPGGRSTESIDADGLVRVTAPIRASRPASTDSEGTAGGRTGIAIGSVAAPRRDPTRASTRRGRRRPPPSASWRPRRRPRHSTAGADGARARVPRRGASDRTYAPRSTSPSAVPSSTGTFWRVRISAVGPGESTALRHACAVSLRLPGRIMRSWGIARRDASCSIGWRVGRPRPGRPSHASTR